MSSVIRCARRRSFGAQPGPCLSPLPSKYLLALLCTRSYPQTLATLALLRAVFASHGAKGVPLPVCQTAVEHECCCAAAAVNDCRACTERHNALYKVAL